MNKQRYWLYRRDGIYYLHDSQTGARESLKTRSKRDAEHVRSTRNAICERPVIGASLAKAYLASQDPKLPTRTWRVVMDEFSTHGNPETQAHHRKVADREPQRSLQNLKLLETTAEDLMRVLKAGGVQANGYVRCLHNLAVGLGWLPWPVLPSKLWPTVRTKPKRAITREEHHAIIAAEQNVERRFYYEVLWEIGAAQMDGALLQAENIDWQQRILSFQRRKTGEWCHLQIGKRLEKLLNELPTVGVLFPAISKLKSNARSAEFCRRCRLLRIKGISLHSYRYAWAQRARGCGYPQRWAQNALGHSSRAVHQAYAGGGVAVCPALEQYEAQPPNQHTP